MKNEELFDKIFDKVAEREMSINGVLTRIHDALKKEAKASDTNAQLLCDAIGSDRSAERKDFVKEFAKQHPHFVVNGSDDVVMCDFVKAADDDTEHRQIRQYRFGTSTSIGELVKLDVCVDRIEITEKVDKTEVVTYESGWKAIVPSRDEEGKIIKIDGITNYVPRKKTQFGYTKLTKLALKATFEALGL